MDPFSAIVGVITLMEAAKKATDYLQAVKDGPKERVRLVQELDDLQSVLENYERLSARLRQTPDAAQSSTLRWLGDLEAKSSPLARSSKELEKLIARLEKPGKGPKGSKRRAATQAWNWPFSQQEATSSLERLGRMRQTLADGLNMDHL